MWKNKKLHSKNESHYKVRWKLGMFLCRTALESVLKKNCTTYFLQTLFNIRSKKYFFLKGKKEKRDQKVSKQRHCTFFRIRLPQKMRSWKILRGGKGSNFLSFLAPGGGDGTWFRILEKKSSTRLAASLCVKFWNDVQFFHSQRMCGKSSGSTCWLWKIMLITLEYNISIV